MGIRQVDKKNLLEIIGTKGFGWELDRNLSSRPFKK
jgi:hypothetical protein